jgi:hypothetical protein
MNLLPLVPCMQGVEQLQGTELFVTLSDHHERLKAMPTF